MADSEERIKITFDTNADSAKKGIDGLGASLEVTDTKAENLAKTFEEVYGELKPLTTRMGEAEDRLYELALAGQTATNEYKDLLAVVGNYRKTQIETDRVVDSAAATLGEKLAGSAQLAATGMSTVTAGLALAGAESQQTQEALLKVQAAMAFADGISQLSTMGAQWRFLKLAILESSAVTKANTAATGAAAIVQKLFTGAVNTTSTGFKLLKLAIASTGVGLLVVGLGLLITNFDKVKKVVLNLVPGLATAAEFIGDIIESITDFVGATSEAERTVERLNKTAQNNIQLNKKFLAEHGSQLNEFTKQKIAAKDEYNAAVQEEGADRIALGKELNRKLAAIEYSRGDEQRKIDKENAEKAQKAREDRDKKAKEDAEKKRLKIIEDAKLLKDSELQAEKDFFKSLADAQKERDDLTAEEKEAGLKLLADLEKNYLDEQLANQKAISEGMIQQEQTLQDARINIAEQGIGLIANVFGKSKAIQKAAIIAENAIGIGKMVIANNAANIGALATPQAIATSGAAAAPVIALNNITTGIGIASTIAATAKALKSVGGGSAGSGQASNVSISRASATPQTGFQASSENQIATSITGAKQDQAIVKAFVVSSDMTDQQKKDANLVSSNSFSKT